MEKYYNVLKDSLYHLQSRWLQPTPKKWSYVTTDPDDDDFDHDRNAYLNFEASLEEVLEEYNERELLLKHMLAIIPQVSDETLLDFMFDNIHYKDLHQKVRDRCGEEMSERSLRQSTAKEALQNFEFEEW